MIEAICEAIEQYEKVNFRRPAQINIARSAKYRLYAEADALAYMWYDPTKERHELFGIPIHIDPNVPGDFVLLSEAGLAGRREVTGLPAHPIDHAR